MNVIKKITTGIILGDTKAIFKDKLPTNGQLAVIQIFGFAKAAKEKETDYGLSFGFSGDFTAINLLTGEEVSSPKMFIPEPLSSALANIINKLEADGEKPNVQVALEIIMKYNGKAATGYEWVTRPLLDIKNSTPATAMLENFKATGKVTPAEQMEAKQEAAVAQAMPEPSAPEKSSEQAAPESGKKGGKR